MSIGTMFLHSISSDDPPLCHWTCDAVKSSYSPFARQPYRHRIKSMEGPDFTASSTSSPSSSDNHGFLDENHFEGNGPADQDTEDRKPIAGSAVRYMNGDNHLSPQFDMRMSFSEDCDDDHRAFNAVPVSALGILDGDHIGIGIIPHAPEFLLQSYQHFAAQPETAVGEECDSVSSHCHDSEEEKDDDDDGDSEQKESDEMDEAFFIDHQVETDHPKENVKLTRVSRRSPRAKSSKVVRSTKAAAKFKNKKSPSRHARDEPTGTQLDIQPTERELRNAINRRQKDALQQWYGKLNELNHYRIFEGHCNVPQQYPPNPQLGIWVNKQRMEKKFMDDGEKSSMTADRKLQLEKIGFTWAKRKGDFSWNEKFQELEDFKRKNGHVDVPTKYEENKALGRWVSTQRSQYKLYLQGERSHMTQGRLDELVSIGFKFDMTTAPPKSASCSRRSHHTEEGSDGTFLI